MKIYNHDLKLFSDFYLDIDFQSLVVTGQVVPVDNTIYDFRNYTPLSERILDTMAFPKTIYDSYFITNQQNGVKYVAR